MALSKAIVKLSVQNASLRVRCMSQQPKKTFFGGLFDNIKEEFNKNKEMKDTIKKFREEAKKLEDSEALKDARKKYKLMEDEKEKGSQVLKDKFEKLSESVKESEITKKAYETSGKAFKKVQETASDLSKTQTMKIVSQNVKAIKSEFDDATRVSSAKLYQPPKELRKRTEETPESQKVYESNTEAQGVVLHKDSKWFQSWNNFKDNNAYINKLFDLKTKYDESDNTLVRATRVITDKFTSLFGGMFSQTEMSNVVTEITKMDPTFETDKFLKFIQFEVIPNILESISRQDLDILKDWCTDTAFTQLSTPITASKQLNYRYETQVLDVHHVDIAAGKMMEQGPVLIVSFISHQVIYVSDLKGEKIIEGTKDKAKQVHHVWALCRDQTVLDPKSAWRLMECHQSATDLVF